MIANGTQVKDGTEFGTVLTHRWVRVWSTYEPTGGRNSASGCSFVNVEPETSCYLVLSADGTKQWWPAKMVEAGGDGMPYKKQLRSESKIVAENINEAPVYPTELTGNVEDPANEYYYGFYG